jgi:hypothetical protein
MSDIRVDDKSHQKVFFSERDLGQRQKRCLPYAANLTVFDTGLATRRQSLWGAKACVAYTTGIEE